MGTCTLWLGRVACHRFANMLAPETKKKSIAAAEWASERGRTANRLPDKRGNLSRVANKLSKEAVWCGRGGVFGKTHQEPPVSLSLANTVGNLSPSHLNSVIARLQRFLLRSAAVRRPPLSSRLSGSNRDEFERSHFSKIICFGTCSVMTFPPNKTAAPTQEPVADTR